MVSASDNFNSFSPGGSHGRWLRAIEGLIIVSLMSVPFIVRMKGIGTYFYWVGLALLYLLYSYLEVRRWED